MRDVKFWRMVSQNKKKKNNYFDCFENFKFNLNKVSGIAKPGEVLAIMGASGAGKTTLLNALTFRNQGNLKLNGDVKINGKLIQNSNQLASISGYVQQNDIFIGTLKVKEHLRFQVKIMILLFFTKFSIKAVKTFNKGYA